MPGSRVSDKYGYIAVISLLTLTTFLALFVFRGMDDNRLTSWNWAFSGTGAVRIFLYLIPAIAVAFVLSRFSLEKRNYAVFLFLASFACCMLFWGEPEVIVDAARYFTQAKHLEIYGPWYFLKEWGRSINAWTDLPLVPFLYGLIFKFIGESRIYIQVFTSVLFSMTVVLTSLIGESLWNRDTGFFAGALLLGMPYLFTQVPLMLVDVPAMFFLAFAVFTFMRALERGRSWIVLASVAIFLVFYSKYSAWLMLSVLAVISMVSIKKPSAGRRWRTVLRRTAAVAFVSAYLIAAPLLLISDVMSKQIDLLISYQKPGLRRWGESFISIFFYQIHPFITVAALYSAYSAVRKKDLKYAAVIWLMILVVLLQIKRTRYIIMTLPMLALMASYGLQSIKDREIRRFVVSCIVMSSLVVAVFAYKPFLQRMSSVNLKDAGVYLDSIDAEDIEVITIPSENYIINSAVSVPILDLFTNKDFCYDYDTGSLPRAETVEESSLRFTWRYKNPGYYSCDRDQTGEKAIVLISSESGQPVPDHIKQRIAGFYVSNEFEASNGVFQYVTIVKVYQRRPAAH